MAMSVHSERYARHSEGDPESGSSEVCRGATEFWEVDAPKVHFLVLTVAALSGFKRVRMLRCSVDVHTRLEGLRARSSLLRS